MAFVNHFPYIYDGEKIKMERARQGISLQELADRAMLDIKTVSRIEHGLAKPRAQTVGRISAALGKDITEFVLKESQEDSE